MKNTKKKRRVRQRSSGSEKSPKIAETDNSPPQFSRAKLLRVILPSVAGGAAVMIGGWRLDVFKYFFEKSGYKIWSEEIDTLNNNELDVDAKPWSDQQILDYFVKDGITDMQLADLTARFHELKDEALTRAESISSSSDGDRNLGQFMNALFVEYMKIKPDLNMRGMRPGGHGFQGVCNEVNRLLISQGIAFTFIAGERGTSVHFFEVEKVANEVLSSDLEAGSWPVVTLKKSTSIKRDPNAEDQFAMAEAVSQGRFITYDSVGSEHMVRKSEEVSGIASPNADSLEYQGWAKAVKEQALRHEIAHSILISKHKIDPNSDKSIGNKGVIDMETYKLDPRVYSSASNMQIHELIARGNEILTAPSPKEVVRFIMHSGGGKGYVLANKVFILDLAHSSEIDARGKATMQNLLGGARIDPSELTDIATKLSDASLKNIGTKMVKLGFHLSR